MPGWVRNSVMLAVVTMWAVYIIGSMVQGQTPPAAIWAVPGVTYAALAGGGGFGKKLKISVEDVPEPPPSPDKVKP